MLSTAAEIVATRQVSKLKPRTFGDDREMLKEKDLDIVLVATPDHLQAGGRHGSGAYFVGVADGSQ